MPHSVDPIAIAFGNAPKCKRCHRQPLRVEYGRDVAQRRVNVLVVCHGHSVQRALDLDRIIQNEPRANMTSAIVAEIRRAFAGAIEAHTLSLSPVARVTECVRRAFVCGNCGAPSDPKLAQCAFCGAHLAGVDR